MTTRWKQIAGITAAVALAVGAAATLAAREQGPFGPGAGIGRRGPGGPGMRGLFPLRGLDLTDAQRDQVRAVMQSHRAEFEAQAQKLGPARRALNDAVTAETLDEAAIRQRAAEVAAIEAEGAVLRARVHGEIWALLTPEQQQKARELKARADQRREQRRERFRQRQQRP
jgi:protein CpxP